MRPQHDAVDTAEVGDAIGFHVIPSICLVLRSGLVLLIDDKEFCASLSRRAMGRVAVVGDLMSNTSAAVTSLKREFGRVGFSSVPLVGVE